MSSFKFIFLLIVMTSINFSSDAQVIEIGPSGLSLFPMGTKLRNDLKSNLSDIDTSTPEGMLEYSNASNDAYDKGLIVKKLAEGKYRLKGVDDSLTSIYIGYNESEEIRQITIECGPGDSTQLKKMLLKVFGNPVVEGEGSIQGVTHESFILSGAGFDISYSGLVNRARFYYPESLEAMLRRLNIE